MRRCPQPRNQELHNIFALAKVSAFNNYRCHVIESYDRPNICLSALSPLRILEPNTHTRYIPPHPQRGTQYHRYVCLLLPQAPLVGSEYTLTGAFRATGPTSVKLDIPIVPDQERLGFNVREFANLWNLNGAKGGGVHMWREVWDDDVSLIYRNVLRKFFFFSRSWIALHQHFFFTDMDEPVFGRPPKVDVYKEVKEQNKYIS